MSHAPIPRERSLDNTLALLAEGYTFIVRRYRGHGSDLFETRLMLTKAVCMTGTDAAAQFYYAGRFTRRRGMPLPVITLIEDLGSVMMLVGERHRHWKAMFLSLMGPEASRRLTEHPAWRERLQAGNEEDLELFVQEVRRFCPFIPLIGGRVLAGFEWRGRRFAPGDWVLMDLYGTNRDPRAWDEPELFRSWNGSALTFIPQGGGDCHETHRCPGEWITIEQKAAARLLAAEMRYEVPEQDLRINLARCAPCPRAASSCAPASAITSR